MFFYQRFQRPPLSPARCRNSCWTYSSTRKLTGHPRPGDSTSGVFSGGISTVDTKNIWGRHETLHTKFCLTYSITDPFPLSELLLCYYTSYLARKGLAPQTIKAYLAALRNAQILLGLPRPTRTVVASTAKKSAGRHWQDTTSNWEHKSEDQTPHHRSCSDKDQGSLAGDNT